MPPVWLRRVWDAPWLWMALVIALFAAPLFIGLDRQDFENDEAMYSFTVDVMVRNGDWLTPKLIPSETTPFLEKPPLKFWLVGLPIHLGVLPLTEFGLRFWDVLMGGLAFLYVFAIGRRLRGPVCGLVAVLLLFIHGPLIFDHGLRTNNMEAAVFLAYAAGIYHFMAWRTAGPDAYGHLVAIALAFVLGFMTKFVAALFLPLVLVIIVLTNRADRFRVWMDRRGVVMAAFVAAALIAPWFVYQYARHGPELFDVMFGAHVVKRFTVYLDPAHLHPWHYYATELWRQLVASGTTVLTVAGAALMAVRIVRHRWVEGVLIAAWVVIPVAIISTGTSKLYHYLYPFLPPVALAGGYAAARVTEWIWRASVTARARTAAVGAIVAVALLAFVLPLRAYPDTIARARRTVRPLHDLRACLTRVVNAEVAEGREAPGVWVEARVISHTYAFYLYHLGPWQQRGFASDITVGLHLFSPASFRPVLLSQERYTDFVKHLHDDRSGLIAATARRTGVSQEMLRSLRWDVEYMTVNFGTEMLLLPGPYRGCAAGHLRYAAGPK